MTNYNAPERLKEMIIRHAEQKAKFMSVASVILSSHDIQHRFITNEADEPLILIHEDLNDKVEFTLNTHGEEYVLTFEACNEDYKVTHSLIIAKTKNINEIINVLDSFVIFAHTLEN